MFTLLWQTLLQFLVALFVYLCLLMPLVMQKPVDLLSSSNLNLENQPKELKLANSWMKGYVSVDKYLYYL